MIIKLVLWVTCTASLLTVGFGSECPTKCKCDLIKVDCSNINLNRIPDQIPVNATVLNLVGNDLQELDRGTLEKFTSIQQMCLQSNNIMKLNSEIFKLMKSLIRLDLSYNQISEVHKRAFTGLSQLSGLVLVGNKIDKLNGALTRTHELTLLNLASNRLTEINKEEFAKLTKLKYLDLSSNLITTIHSEAFENLKELRFLNLQNNKITSLGVLSFSSRLLSMVDFTKNALVRMPRGLPNGVTDLRAGHNNIGGIEKDDLSNMTRLQLLTLNDNSISKIHDDAFKGTRNLKEIWLASNKLTSLPKTLPAGLVKLFVNSNKIKKIEKDAFDDNRFLQYLTLEMNELTEISAKALGKLISLTYLNIQGNQLSQLSKDVFVGMKSLQVLTLANNPIAIIEADSLGDLDALNRLDMSYNELNDIKLHMDIFRAMPKLKELNVLNSPGLAKSLIDQIKKSAINPAPSVQTIDFQYNNLKNLPEEFQLTFPNLTMLKLTHNAWHCDSKMVWMKKYLEIPRIRFSENLERRPVCCTPRQLKGKAITDVPEKDFLTTPSDEGERKEDAKDTVKVESKEDGVESKEDGGESKDGGNDIIKAKKENQMTMGNEINSGKINLSLIGVKVKNHEDDTNEPKSRKKRRKGNRKNRSRKSRKERKNRDDSEKKKRRRRRRRRYAEEA